QLPSDATLHCGLQSVGDGALVLDLEPYAGFWAGGDFNCYLDNLTGYGPAPDDYQCWVSIDPRRIADGNVAGWVTRVAGLMPQLYWPDFGQDPWACVGYLNQCIQLAGGDASRVIPVLSSAADPS